MLKRKNKNSVANENVHDLRQVGDVKFDQHQDNSSHLSNTEFARDFEECCNVEFGRDNENQNNEFGEENLRRNNVNLECSREFENNYNNRRNNK